MARAEEIRIAIAAKPIQTQAGALPLTMSIGVLLSHEWGPRPMQELMQEVDLALYAAKAAGRNCIRRADPGSAKEFVPLPVPSETTESDPVKRT